MMAGTHDRYAEWDGAYIMGALSRTEREEFEAHLAECPRCEQAVTELGTLPGLLARVPEADAEALTALPGDAGPPPYLGERAVAAARAERVERVAQRGRWRRHRVLVAVAGAAAALVLGLAVPWALHDGAEPGTTTAAVRLTPVVDVPLSAQVRLTDEGWGTRVDMVCHYEGEYGPARSYSLYVIDREGRAGLVSTWRAAPGQTARTSGSTDLAVDDIAGLELRGSSGNVLLSAPVDAQAG